MGDEPKKSIRWRRKLTFGAVGVAGFVLIGIGTSHKYAILAPVGAALLAAALFALLPPRKF